MVSRTIIVGDVHGCADELDDLCRALAFDPASDALVFVGDLVAKGPDSRGVLARALQWGAQAVLGNHEDALLTMRGSVSGEGHTTALPDTPHGRLAAALSDEEWAQLAAMPLWLELDAGIVVHAGIVPGVPMAAQRREHLLCMRTLATPTQASSRHDAGPLWASEYTGPPFIFFGHHARQGLQEHPHALGLDSGCVYGGQLTAAVLPEGQLAHRQLVAVPARRTYVSAGPRATAPGVSA